MGRTSNAKARLIAAMAQLAHRRGYADVGVDDVCRTAGVQKGSFYYFFASKRDLMLAAFEYQWQRGAEQMVGSAFRRDLPPLERIERLFSNLAEAESGHKKTQGHVLGCPFGNIAAEVSTSDPGLARRADRAFCGLARVLQAALTEAQAEGQLDRGVDAKDAAEALVAYFEGLALLARTRNDPSLIRRLGRRALQLAIQPSSRSPARRRRPAERQR